MLDRGISESDLCFDFDTYPGDNTNFEHAGCTEEKNRVFNPNGGGMRYSKFPAKFFDNSFSAELFDETFFVSGTIRIHDLPLTNSSDEAELLLVIPAIKKDICESPMRLASLSLSSVWIV